MERGDALPPFSTAATATPEGTASAPESDLSERRQLEPGGAALGVTEGGQTTRNRGVSLCTFCGRALGNSTGGSAVDSLWACIPCPHGEQVHSSCMLDRAERRASEHADQQPVLRVAPNGRQETGLPIRLRWRRTFQGHCQGESGRWWKVHCNSPNSLRKTAPGCCSRQVTCDWLPRDFRVGVEDPWEEPNFLVLAVLPVQRYS